MHGPVDKYIKILRTLSVEKTSVNNLAKITGYSFKRSLTDKVKTLENEKLVKRSKDEKHKQKQYIELTKLGGEIIKFLKDFEEIKNSYNSVSRNFSDYLDLSLKDIKIRNNLLKTKNWSEKDIENFDDFIAGIQFLKGIIVTNIFDIVENRYRSLFINHEVKDIGKLIINYIFQSLIEFISTDLIEFDKREVPLIQKHKIEEFKKSIIETTFDRMYYYFPAIIFDDIKKLCKAYIELINPSKDTLKSLWEEENKIDNRDRSTKKTKSYFDLGPIHTELAKKGYPDGSLSSFMLSKIAEESKFKLEPNSKLLHDIYRDLLN